MKFSEIAWSSDQAPATPGIYHIVHEKSVLYVGSTANIYRRFTNHRTDPWMKFVLLKGFDLAWFWHDFSSTDLSQKQRHRLAVAVELVTIKENIRRGNCPSAIYGRRTHCWAGHEFTKENTYLRPDGGGRSCLTCRRASALKCYYNRKRTESCAT